MAASADTSDWSFDLTPYLWVADIGLKTSIPQTPSSGPETERFETRIAAGAMLTAEAHYRSFGVLADVAWLRLNTEAINPAPAYSSVDLRSDFVHTTAALTYPLPLEGKFKGELLAGARVWYVANDVHASSGAFPGFAASKDNSWADPVVGGNLSYEIASRWSADVKGLVGGFGVTATIAGEAFAGVTWRCTDVCSVSLGYRFLYEQYSRDHFTFDLNAQGALLGVGFHF